MPRRKKSKPPAEPTPTATPTRPNFILARDHMTPEQLAEQGFGPNWACGCYQCKPDYWCQAVNDKGERCGMAGKKWEQVPGGTWCYSHMLQEHGKVVKAELAKGVK